jgi:hypothetical protein
MVLARPAQAVNHDAVIDLAQASELHEAIVAAGDDRAAMRNAAIKYTKRRGAAFVARAGDNTLAKEIETFASRVEAALDGALNDQPLYDLLVAAVTEAFGVAPATLVERTDFQKADERCRDSIVAIKALPERHSSDIEGLVVQLRHLELVREIAAGADSTGSHAAVGRLLRRPLRLPISERLEPVLRDEEAEAERTRQTQELAAKWTSAIEERVGRFNAIRAALDELASIGRGSFVVTEPKDDKGAPLAEALSVDGLTERQLRWAEGVSGLVLEQLRRITEPGRETLPVSELASQAELVKAAAGVVPEPAAGLPPIVAGLTTGSGLRVRAEVAERLSSETTTLLNESELDLSTQPLDEVSNRLAAYSSTIAAELGALTAHHNQVTLRRFGAKAVAISKPIDPSWLASLSMFPLDLLPPVLDPGLLPSVPATKGKVASIGVADLLVVRQQLKGYERADVAHIQNVLRGEMSTREHVRRRTTEEFTFTETETTTTEERELESTNRFEISRETEEVIKTDASLKAGLTVSGKYGPTVEFSASAEGSVSKSKERATRSASEFAQDVTDRAASKVTERVLQRQSMRVTNEVIETNTDSLDNRDGPDHITGVYQWVTKVYEAQMFNYGIRTMFDFMVPEPAAALVKALADGTSAAATIVAPPAFTLTPDQVSEYNYGHYVQVYGATDVDPPPPLWVTRSEVYAGTGGDKKTDYTHSATIDIPDGYEAALGEVVQTFSYWKSSGASDVILGDNLIRRSVAGDAIWRGDLDGETGSIPFAVKTYAIETVAVGVEVWCKRTSDGLRDWKHDTHAKLMTAYRARLAEYEEELDALEAEADLVEIEGRHPAANLELMRDELRKHCLSIITAQHFDLFGAIVGSGSTPFEHTHIDLDEAAAEGAYVRFFEQAFEWEHMTWVTYPYYWGRKSQWAAKVTSDDVDPRFNEFLKAGYCRVSVPARPGFEGAIDHFLTFGEVWMGGPLPTVSSDLFLPIAEEIAERLDRPGDEEPQGVPWEVRVPTTLVALRKDDRLPVWEKLDGDWVEAEGP